MSKAELAEDWQARETAAEWASVLHDAALQGLADWVKAHDQAVDKVMNSGIVARSEAEAIDARNDQLTLAMHVFCKYAMRAAKAEFLARLATPEATAEMQADLDQWEAHNTPPTLADLARKLGLDISILGN